MKELTDLNPERIVVSTTMMEDKSQGEPGNPVLVAYATAFDQNNNAIGVASGCPSPCHPVPFTAPEASCQNRAEELLASYESKGMFGFFSKIM